MDSEKDVVHLKDIVMEKDVKISTKDVKLENFSHIHNSKNAFLKKSC